MKKVLHAFGSIKLFNVVIRLFEFISSFAKCMKDFFILFFLTLSVNGYRFDIQIYSDQHE